MFIFRGNLGGNVRNFTQKNPHNPSTPFASMYVVDDDDVKLSSRSKLENFQTRLNSRPLPLPPQPLQSIVCLVNWKNSEAIEESRSENFEISTTDERDDESQTSAIYAAAAAV